MSKKITFVIGSLEVGGAESQLSLLVRTLVSHDWQVVVFTLEERGPLVNMLRTNGVIVRSGGYSSDQSNKLIRMLLLIKAQLLLILHFMTWRPNVVHAFLPLTNFMGSLAGRLTCRPCIIISKRGLGTHQDRRPIWGKIDKFSQRFAHHITTNSKAIALDTEQRDGYPAERVHIIGNGLDMSRFLFSTDMRANMRRELRIASSDIAIVHVANLIAYKGHSTLISAIAEMKGHNLPIKLFLIGKDQNTKDGLIKQAQELGVFDQIHFLGGRDNVPELLTAMDIGVLPSYEEGLPNALIEKLASGLPIVASDVGGIPEICDGVPDCALIQPSDPTALALALTHQVTHLQDIANNGHKRRDIMQSRYSITAMVDAYTNLYQSARN